MTRVSERWLPELFVAIVLVLVAFGILVTYSSSVFYAQDVFKNKLYFFQRELLWVAVGMVVAVILATVRMSLIERMALPVLLLTTGLLVLVFVPGVGRKVNSAYRWLKVGGFTLQPSEPAKYAVILFVAAYLARWRRHITCLFQGILLPLAVVMIPTGLIVAEPDLGTPVVILATVFVMFYVAGARLVHLLSLVGGAVPILVLLVVKYPYRFARLLVFLDPDKDPLRTGFQIRQSLIAIGSGKLNGVGLGRSVQKMHYLPEAHTDFVFAIVGEELGFVGCASLAALFLILFYLMYRMTEQVENMFGHLVATGILTLLSLQTIVNMAVVTGCLPTKGIALPFISYGGSGMVMTIGACGLLVNIVVSQYRAGRAPSQMRVCGETIV